jgi:hypothetical protein
VGLGLLTHYLKKPGILNKVRNLRVWVNDAMLPAMEKLLRVSTSEIFTRNVIKFRYFCDVARNVALLVRTLRVVFIAILKHG